MYEAVAKDFSNATDLADYLVNKDLPFREAHAVVGQVVLHCIQENIYLLDLSIADFRNFSKLIEEDIYDVLAPRAVVNARDVVGGTARNRVADQMTQADKRLSESKSWIEIHAKKVNVLK
ncbi:argininosuccinate lyase [Gracilibacillus boraciitolerans JCM 21714]|uniref:argininosuccinate lyase n=1 Tax=Gracilibacillus boraciitolerans JCM 21714 TaxID=1298598 RepID=W4VJD4_9BACI|nr:argininosuccinate lyase [Gracilibacillus boraciitolerans JCM 21714]